MLPFLLSFLSGVRELSATASLAEVQQPKAPLELPDMSGVSSRDLIASLCPVAVAFVVASIRYYNEKQMEQRTSDPQAHSSPLLTFGDVDSLAHGDCGDLSTALQRRRSGEFYVSDASVVVFRVCASSVNAAKSVWKNLTRCSEVLGRRGAVPCPQTLLLLRTKRLGGYVRHLPPTTGGSEREGTVGRCQRRICH